MVLRAGPPPERKSQRDLIVGVIGALILLASLIVPAVPGLLWQPTVLPPQYKVSFGDVRTDLPARSQYIDAPGSGANASFRFEYEVPEDNVHTVTLFLHFQDDLNASDFDKFRIEVKDPFGSTFAAEFMQSDPPGVNATDPTRYDSPQERATFVYALRPKPQDTIVDGNLNSTEESTAAEQEALNRLNTKGTWVVTVTAVETRGCPTPGSGADLLARAAACRRENQDKGAPAPYDRDRGNLFTIGTFSYTRFTVSVEKL